MTLLAVTGMATSSDRPLPKRIASLRAAPPSTSPFEVPRLELLGHIHAAAAKVVLIHAPAGFGKTTLMRQLRDSEDARGIQSIWLPLDDADNDASRFLSGFAVALDEILPAGVSSSPKRSAEAALWVVDQLNTFDGPLNIFFDDLDALHNPVVLGLMNRGLEAVPQHVRIIIGARSAPDIGLSRLRARGDLTEIDAGALRFSTPEAYDFLTSKRRLPLSTSQVNDLLDCTEGWPAALWLASLSLERRYDPVRFLADFSGSNTAIASYFAEDVVAALPVGLREFILRSSILDELSPILCNAVCGVDNAGSILRELERKNLFLHAIRAGTDRFRFHGLFRDFLQSELKRRLASELPSLHRRATIAYIALDQPIHAVGHALDAGTVDTAIQLIVSNVDTLLSRGRFSLVGDWLDRLPRTELLGSPRLRLIRAWCTSVTHGSGEALSAVADIDGAGLPAESAAQLLALRPMLLARMDRIKEAYDLGLQALGHMPSTPSFASSMLYQVLAQTSAILGYHDESQFYFERMGPPVSTTDGCVTLADSTGALVDLMRGHLKRALLRVRPTTRLPDALPEAPWTGNAAPAIHVAELLYECDHCDAAQRLLFASTSLVQGTDLPDPLISAHTIRARIASSKGDYDLALQSLEELEVSGHRMSLPRVIASARLERSVLYLSRGDSAGAFEQLLHAKRSLGDTGPETTNLQSHWFAANDTLTPEIVELRWMIRTGASASAIPLLRSAMAEALQSLRAKRALKLRILLAEALYCNGERVEGLRILSRAQHLAQGEGFVRTFLEEGPVIAGMVVELRLRRGEDPDKLTIAPASCPREANVGSDQMFGRVAPPALESPLTQTELKVLKMTAQGFLNEAMAERLFVSDSTVRTHLRNINAKLHASNRVEAAIIGRRLGLIS